MWKVCEGKWCGSKYEEAYREGYEQGFEDAKRIFEAEQKEKTNELNEDRS